MREAHVLAALEHAWDELKLDVNDRIPWDVIGVIEGPGKINERTIVTFKDQRTDLEIGKLELDLAPAIRARLQEGESMASISRSLGSSPDRNWFHPPRLLLKRRN